MKIRSLSSFEAAAVGVDTRSSAANEALRSGMRGGSQVGDVDAPATEIVGLFPFQSYYDDTLLEKAIFTQPVNQSIVPSTMSDPIQLSGYAVGLHPSSETPVCIIFDAGSQQGRSPAIRLRPGQVIRPFGRPGAGVPGAFSGFRWGLPAGWLGGGSATLVVMRTADAQVKWYGESPEIVYHRTRLNIYDPSMLPDVTDPDNFPFNWPTYFPWPKAISKFTGTDQGQGGRPGLSVTPSRTALKLNKQLVAGTVNMRAIFVGSDPWSQSGTTPGIVDLSVMAGYDFAFNPWAQIAGAVTPYDQVQQTLWFTDDLARISCNYGAMLLTTEDSDYWGITVDALRYGRL